MRNSLILSLLLLCAPAAPALADDPRPLAQNVSPQSDFPPQMPYSQCVEDPDSYLGLAFGDFDQGVEPDGDGPRREWGWRTIGRQEECYAAVAMLISQWRDRHEESLNIFQLGSLAIHEGQFRAAAGDYEGAIPLIEEARDLDDDVVGQIYKNAILAFLRFDRDALIAAREQLLATPEPSNWPELQRLFREQAGQEMEWPLNIEATDILIECFGKPYPVDGEC